MTYLDKGRAHVLAQRLGRLPQDAADSTVKDASNGAEGQAWNRPLPGSKPPPGVDLDRIDLNRGRERPALLARLSGCVRVVHEEVGSDGMPPASEEGQESWHGECRWLLRTMPRWATSDWCAEWIDTETLDIERKLKRAAIKVMDLTRMVCETCHTRIEPHATETLIVAQCPKCERVAGMAPRLTPEQRRAEMAGRERGARALLTKLGVLP